MAGRIFIHIGPQKTATTSLQALFKEGVGSDIFFAGVEYPRRKNNSELARRLLFVCANYKNVDNEIIDSIINEVDSLLNKDLDILMSEEVFTVDRGVISYQELLSNLAKVLGNFKVRIIVCGRDPRKALPSLYQEWYSSLPVLHKISYKNFLYGNQASVFDYERLCSTIEKCGFSDIVVFPFDDLINGRLTYGDLFGDCEYQNKKIVLPVVHISNVDKQGTRVLVGFRLKDFSRIHRLLPMSWRKSYRSVKIKNATDTFFQEEEHRTHNKSNPIINIWRAFLNLPVYKKNIDNLELPVSILNDYVDSYTAVLRKYRHIKK